jgi:enoyl-[acyl-carrier protein] reductase / trans-2-enoyl-CoA reductase (NAD+)
MDPATQAKVTRLWDAITAENVLSLTDYAGFQHDFRRLFGFEVAGIDYAAPVEIGLPLVPEA